MTNESSSEQWTVGNVQYNLFIGNKGPIIPDNQGTVNITYEAAPLPEAIGLPNNLRRSGTVAFVGRDDILSELHERLNANECLSIFSIRGMGGVGKTELALQYSLRYGQNYTGGLCWLRAREDVGPQIIGFARTQLDLTPPTDLEVLEQVAYCWRHWRAGEVLIIFDDVQQYKDIESFLPPSEQRFKTLLTTRKQLGGAFSELALEILARSDSLALLQTLVTDGRIETEFEQAGWLCNWLGDLPLGLELVGRYLTQKPTVTLTKLRDRLERKRLDARALENIYPGMTATAGIAAAFEVSWDLLEADTQHLAGLLSLFAQAPIPWQLIQDCLFDEDEEDLEDRRDSLVALHLLQFLESEVNESYQLHQLLREFFTVKFQETTNFKELSERFCKVMVTVSLQIPETPTLEDITTVAPAIFHIAETAITLENYMTNQELSCLFVGLGRFYTNQGLYEKAIHWAERHVETLKTRLGDTHLSTVNAFNSLGVLHLYRGQYQKAIVPLLSALKLRQKILGIENSDVAESFHNVGELHRRLKSYQEAEKSLSQALSIRKRLFGEKHSSVAQSLNSLAGIYKTQGFHNKAEQVYLSSLKLRQNILGIDHSDVAETLNNLGDLYCYQQRYREAEPLLSQALNIRARLFGEKHPSVGQSLNNLAVLYANQDRFEEAKELMERALEMFEEYLGEKHPDTNITRASLRNIANDLKNKF